MKVLLSLHKRGRFVLRLLLSGGALALIYFTIFFILRIYFFDTYIVPSFSMHPTIKRGDKVVVNKRIIGARIYKSFDFSANAPLVSYRTKGERNIEINDIVVFNYPIDSTLRKIQFKINYVYVKRCVGLPGDTIAVKQGFIYNNNYAKTIALLAEQQRLSVMDSVSLKRHIAFPQLTTSATSVNWTIRDFGPFWIPCSGRDIDITPRNVELYGLYIEYETDKKLSVNSDGCVLLGGVVLSSYTFTKDYYFVCGDNFTASYDSRNWGVVPYEFMIGVVDRGI